MRPGWPRHATVVAYIALFAALGGSALALPGRNSVDSGDIKDAEVAAPDIRTGAVRTARIAAGSVTTADLQSVGPGGRSTVVRSKLAEDAVTAPDINPGSVYDFHIQAATIGGSRLRPLVLRAGTPVNVPGGTGQSGDYDTAEATASCLAGEVAIAGGSRWDVSTDDFELVITYSAFIGVNVFNPAGFAVRGGNDTGTDRTLTAEVLCLD